MRLMNMCVLLAASAGVAHADPPELGTDQPVDSYAWTEEGLRTGIGVSVIAGGGITGFTDRSVRNATSSVGGLWDLRVTIGSHTPLGLELGYLGSAQNIDSQRGAMSGTLVGSTFESAVRYNVLPHSPVNPYAFAGIGYLRYDVTGASFSPATSGIKDSDNNVEFPMGAGMQYRTDGFVADVRGTFRAVPGSTLVLSDPSAPASNHASMHSWGASAALGYEF